MQAGDSVQVVGKVHDIVGANCLVRTVDLPGIPGAEYWFHLTDCAVVPPVGGWPRGTTPPAVTMGSEVEILGTVEALTSDSVVIQTPGTPAQVGPPPVAAIPGWFYGLRSQHVAAASAAVAEEEAQQS